MSLLLCISFPNLSLGNALLVHYCSFNMVVWHKFCITFHSQYNFQGPAWNCFSITVLNTCVINVFLPDVVKIFVNFASVLAPSPHPRWNISAELGLFYPAHSSRHMNDVCRKSLMCASDQRWSTCYVRGMWVVRHLLYRLVRFLVHTMLRLPLGGQDPHLQGIMRGSWVLL